MGMATSLHRGMCRRKSSSGFMHSSERISMESPFYMHQSSFSVSPFSLSSRSCTSRGSGPPSPPSTISSSISSPYSSSSICGCLVLYAAGVSKTVSSLVSPCLPPSPICMSNSKHIRYPVMATSESLHSTPFYPSVRKQMTLYLKRGLVTNCIIAEQIT